MERLISPKVQYIVYNVGFDAKYIESEGDMMRNGTITVPGCDDIYNRYGAIGCRTVTTQSTKEKNVGENLRIIRLLYGIGISITSVGFHYFYTAILICMNDALATTNAQKNIYMVIAEHYNVSHKSVERAMRTAFNEEVSESAMRLFERETKIVSFGKDEELTPLQFISLVALMMDD